MEQCINSLKEQKSSKFITEKLLISNLLNVYDLEPKKVWKKYRKTCIQKISYSVFSIRNVMFQQRSLWQMTKR